ncbi:MAG: SCO family protein [Candidatus Eisenbacteria bacterium]|uniref:SCO family protein n=1 Tax=Eiseniibacteriota bacterium TaxID=2212470 RepID=A0A933SCL4_UNCEI|nr:SCO family protein [Candidatus Eisenbacteria bacterium]
MNAASPDGTSPRTGATLLLCWVVGVVVWWGFAFVPAPPGAEAWLAAAQSACFGSRPGGMPAPHGWLMLTLAPALMLGTMWAAFGADMKSSLPLLMHSRGPRLLSAVLVLLFVGEVGLAAKRMRTAQAVESVSFASTLEGPLPADWPRTAKPVPAFALVDQAGARFTQDDLAHGPVVLSFVFAHCTTVCPMLVRTLEGAREELGGTPVRMALVTLDPWRDTPAALPGLAATFRVPEGARLLSGAPEAVCALLDTLGVARARDLRTGDVSHAPLVMVLDADGRIAYTFQNPPSGWIADAVRRCRTAS